MKVGKDKTAHPQSLRSIIPSDEERPPERSRTKSDQRLKLFNLLRFQGNIWRNVSGFFFRQPQIIQKNFKTESIDYALKLRLVEISRNNFLSHPRVQLANCDIKIARSQYCAEFSVVSYLATCFPTLHSESLVKVSTTTTFYLNFLWYPNRTTEVDGLISWHLPAKFPKKRF